MERIPLVVADDHVQVRAQVLNRLQREADLQVVGVAENSRAAVAVTLEHHPRLLLIDPMMSDGMGLDAIRHIRSQAPDTAIVVLTAFADTAQRIELLRLGVRHILNKGIESRKLVTLLKQAGGLDSPNGSG